MIDYLKLEQELKPLYDYKAEKEYRKKIDKNLKKGTAIYLFFLISLICTVYFLEKDKDNFFNSLELPISITLIGFSFMMFMELTNNSNKNFETDNFETEENLNKVSEFKIKNITNFKENISLLRRKAEYMILDESFKKTKIYSAKEVYINKILNIFYGTDKTDLKKQDLELLELLKK